MIKDIFKSKIIWLIVVLTVLVLGVGVAAFYGINYATEYPQENPEQTLAFGEKAQNFISRIIVPIKAAGLVRQDPPEEILMPVYGVPVEEVEDTWGAPRSSNRQHEGQDIFADFGTPIFAAAEGFIFRKNIGTLGGNYIFVLGAGGWRYYYAHMDEFAKGLKVGDWVTTDTVLGFVGNTGNAETTPPHLHMGIYTPEPINFLPLMINR